MAFEINEMSPARDSREKNHSENFCPARSGALACLRLYLRGISWSIL
jgi:hypothetical protein